MTNDLEDLARRVDAVFAPLSGPPEPSGAPPEDEGPPRSLPSGSRVHAKRWRHSRCCCGHERDVHLHYRAGTDCSQCACPHFDRVSPIWLFWGLIWCSLGVWGWVIWESAR